MANRQTRRITERESPSRRALLLVLPTLLACASTAEPDVFRSCPSVVWSAIAVNVRDARTGRPAAWGAILYGTYHSSSLGIVVDTAKSVTPDSLTMHTGASPGTYDLRLVVPGYAEWTRNGVVVQPRPSGCGPQLATVEASVERLPQ